MSKTNFIVRRDELKVMMDRVFEAPVERVFEAYTNPKLIPKWWGPSNLTTIVDKMDLKVGGIWRFIHRDRNRDQYAFNGVYSDIIPNKKLASTFEFEPQAGHIVNDTAEFESLNGKTKLKVISLYSNTEDLDSVVHSGMEAGAKESMDRLAKLVENF